MGTNIVFTSGKGGTGKTTCVGATASALALLGKKTLCIDCDVGLKNLDLTLGLTDDALWDFSDVMEMRATPEEAIVRHPKIDGLFFLSAPADMSPDQVDSAGFASMVRSLSNDYDYLILDCPAGLGSGFALATSCADMAVVIATGDASSLRDGQRTVSRLREDGADNVRLIVNRVKPGAFRRMHATVDDVIDAVGAQLIGLVSEDDTVSLSANLETPLMLCGSKNVCDQFRRVARRIIGERVPLGRI